MKTVSVVIPVWNGRALIKACLDSLEPQLLPGDEIIVADNGSVDGTPELVEHNFPRVQVLRLGRNWGYGGGANRGMAEARGDAILILNHDITFRDGCIAALRQRLEASGPAVLGCKLLYPDGCTIQHAGGIIRLPRGEADHYGYRRINDGRWDQVSEPDYVTGALFVIDRAVINTIGVFDEVFFPLYYEEVDYCYRAREAGFPVIYEPGAVALHHESQTQDKRSEAYHQTMEYHRVRFMLKHFSPQYLVRDFYVAERSYLQGLPWLFARTVFARAYLRALLNLPDVAWLRSDIPDCVRVLDALADLYRLACRAT